MKEIEFHLEASHEVTVTAAFYDEKQSGLGKEFTYYLDTALLQIQKHPHRFHFYKNSSVQRCLLDKFPLAIYFTEELAQIFIIAVAHQSRKTDYWRDRI